MIFITIGLILAGGVGKRMNRAIPKQFMELEQVPVILRTLRIFEKCEKIDCIVVVCVSTHIDYLNDLIAKSNLKKDVYITSNGNNKNDSIRLGVEYIKAHVVNDGDCVIVIHYANMPLVSIENIDECITKLSDGYDVVTTAAICNEYFYEIFNDGLLGCGPDRNNLLLAKVPESIRLSVADELFHNKNFMIEKYASYSVGMLAILNQKKVTAVYCDATNFKITTEDDYILMQSILQTEKHLNDQMT